MRIETLPLEINVIYGPRKPERTCSSIPHGTWHTYLHMFGTKQSRPDQSGALAGPQHVRVHRQRQHVVLQLLAKMLPFAGVIHQDDLLEQGPGRAINYTPDCSQQRAPCFVVEHYHYRGGWQFGGVVLLFTAAGETKGATGISGVVTIIVRS